jgi:hypothetical protein
MPVSAEHDRAVAAERLRRHRARRAEAGERRLDIKLPAEIVAALDTTRGTVTRSEAVLEALADWLHRRRPAAPTPTPPPAGKTRRPRGITT